MTLDQTEQQDARASLIVISDFIWPWCYVGLVEVEKLRENYEIDIAWAPFLLDPSIPPEGRTREPYTKPGDPPTHLELRGQDAGINFARGRKYTPNSHLALELAEFAQDIGHSDEQLHRALFRTHFEDGGNIGDLHTLITLATESGLDGDEVREVLESGRYREQVDHRIAWAQAIGVTGVPTFVINDKYGVVGAQEYAVFERAMEQLGVPRRRPGTDES